MREGRERHAKAGMAFHYTTGFEFSIHVHKLAIVFRFRHYDDRCSYFTCLSLPSLCPVFDVGVELRLGQLLFALFVTDLPWGIQAALACVILFLYW